MRVFVALQDPIELKNWLVWSEGWSNWVDLASREELFVPIERELQVEPPGIEEVEVGVDSLTLTDSMVLPKSTDQPSRSIGGERVSESEADPVVGGVKNFTMTDIDIDGELEVELEVLETQNTQKSNIMKDFVKRNFKRYRKQLKVQVTGKEGQSFSSLSKDISVGGILLEEPLPRWVAGYVQVKIVDRARKQAIEVTCSVVEDQDPRHRVRLEILPLEKKEEEVHFDKWLAA